MRGYLTEKEAEDILEKNKFVVVKRATAKTKKSLKKIEDKIGYPWAMKASSRKIVHKAKLGAVELNIKSFYEAEKAFIKLSKIPDFEEVMVQEMVSGEEIIIGLKDTTEFGHVIMFGKGGSKVEQEKDVSFRVLPANKEEFHNMIKETRIFEKLLERKINISAILNVLSGIEKISRKYKHIKELDINPLMVNEKQAIVVDARIVFEKIN